MADKIVVNFGAKVQFIGITHKKNWIGYCLSPGMDTVQTQYGLLPVDGVVDRYPDGGVRGAFVSAAFHLVTSLGRLTPQHTIDDARRMTKPPVTFFQNGQVRSVPLEKQTMVPTPVGPLPAELVTFHENGAVARVFPLNGKLSGYWTEADEAGRAETLRFTTPVGPVAARMVAVAFDPQGRLRSLTLWSGETLTVPSPAGDIPVRLGLSFHPEGALRSAEPARPVEVSTPAGPVWAFDPDAVGISGDDNSLVFDPTGAVARVATVRTALTVRLPDGTGLEIAPAVRESICGDSEREITPLVLEFADDAIVARHGPARPAAILPRTGAVFSTRPHVPAFAVAFSPKQCSM
jgi:hypothetical protein